MKNVYEEAWVELLLLDADDVLTESETTEKEEEDYWTPFV